MKRRTKKIGKAEEAKLYNVETSVKGEKRLISEMKRKPKTNDRKKKLRNQQLEDLILYKKD